MYLTSLKLNLVFLILLGIKSATVSAKDVNLTAITWAHAVNSKALLSDALNSDIDYIEADITFGILLGDESQTQQPIMGHPPVNTSDLSLAQFLGDIQAHNNNSQLKKGVKLDFKSIDAFQTALDLLQSLWNSMDYPVWINADIIAGPVNNTETKPVEPNAFFDGCKRFPTAVLSIGWTTRWGNNFTEGIYTKEQIANMIETIKANKIQDSLHGITFPVRAGIAAQSIDNLHELVNAVNATTNVTLTIWSSENDKVDVDLLRKLIFSFGLNRVYVDVPEELSSQLILSNVPGRASSLIHFGIVTVLMLFTSLLLNDQF